MADTDAVKQAHHTSDGQAKKFYEDVPMETRRFFLKGASSLDWGMKNRLSRIFSPDTGRTVMLAIDHGYFQGPTTGLERIDWDINNENPADAAMAIAQRIKERPIPFHWFRNILKTPSWYVQLVEELKKANPKIELLDAPTFFELYKIYLKSTIDAAAGKYPYFQ